MPDPGGMTAVVGNVREISAAGPIASLSVETLASVLDQSMDCVKVVSLDGRLTYMNYNGQCAMEVDDFCAVEGVLWTELWPADARAAIEASYDTVKDGGVARFTAFCPTTKGTPRWWHVTVSPVVDGDGRHNAYLSVSRDITDAELGRQAAETATAEMRHRLRNTYTMIASLMRNFARGNAEREDFASEMTDRMISLGAAQTLFADKEHAPCEIAELIPALVEAFDGPTCPISVEVIGDMVVNQGQADAIALVVGELAVNSAKHGAINAGGDIRVTANETEGALIIVWSETSHRAIAGQSREGGQGLVLMQRIVGARRGKIALEWSSHGLDATITFTR